MINISIVIPVYNVEDCLNRCIKSLLNLEIEGIEIILVNDGSTDSSGIMCDDYSKKYSNIKVIHKENGGLSDARNVGLKEAMGEYVLFIDSDDFIDKKEFEKLYKLTRENVQVIIGDSTRITKKSSIAMVHDKNFLNIKCSGKEFMKNELKNTGSLGVEVWRNIYLRTFLLENNLYFKKGILHEDEEWTPRVLLLAESVIYTGINFYNYIIRNNSITQKKNKLKNAIDLINTCHELEEVFNRIKDMELKGLLNNYLLGNYFGAFYIGKMHKKEYSKYIKKDFMDKKSISLNNRIKVLAYKINKNLAYILLDINNKLSIYRGAM